MLTSSNEWTILEWNGKLLTNNNKTYKLRLLKNKTVPHSYVLWDASLHSVMKSLSFVLTEELALSVLTPNSFFKKWSRFQVPVRFPDCFEIQHPTCISHGRSMGKTHWCFKEDFECYVNRSQTERHHTWFTFHLGPSVFLLTINRWQIFLRIRTLLQFLFHWGFNNEDLSGHPAV